MPPGLQVNVIPIAGARLTEGESAMTGTSREKQAFVGICSSNIYYMICNITHILGCSFIFNRKLSSSSLGKQEKS